MVVLASATGLLVSCGSGSSGSSSGTDPSATGPLPSLPTVKVVLDAARAVFGTATADGLTLVAHDAQGATLTLTVPAGALASPVEIRMTPVTGMTGLSLSGGLVSGVHFEPEGLQFALPATLVIRPVASVVPGGGSSIVAVGYSGGGNNLHLVPVAGADPGTESSIAISHFSGYGTAVGTSQEIDGMLSAQGNYLLGMAIVAEGSADPALVLDPLYPMYSGWSAMVLGRPQFAAMAATIATRIANALTMAVQRAALDCYNNHDLSRAQKIVGWASWAQSRPEIMQVLGNVESFRLAAVKCARFELVFDVTYVVSTTAGPGTFQAAATVPIAPLSGLQWPFSYVATGPISETVQWYPIPKCTSIAEGIGSTLMVMSMAFDPVARSVNMVLNPGTPGERVTITCPPADASPPSDLNTWVGLWVLAHIAELDASTGGYAIGGWLPGQGDVFAEASFSRTVPNASGLATENGRLTLRHVPLL